MFVLISDVSDNEDDSEDEENNKNSRNSRNNAAGIKGQKNIKDCFVSLKMEKGGDIKSKTKTEKVSNYKLFFCPYFPVVSLLRCMLIVFFLIYLMSEFQMETETSATGVSWPEPSVGTFKGKVIYDEVLDCGLTYKAGDYVMDQGTICQIVYFYEKNGKSRAHLKVFNRADDTLLTDTADPHEIVDVNECSNVKVESIKVKVLIDYCLFLI